MLLVLPLVGLVVAWALVRIFASPRTADEMAAAAVVSVLGFGTTIIFGAAILGQTGFQSLSTFDLALVVLVLNTALAVVFGGASDLLEKIPGLGPALTRARLQARASAATRPWIRKWATAGLALFVISPLPGSGVFGGSVVGRVAGLTRVRTFISVWIANAIVCAVYALFADALATWMHRNEMTTLQRVGAFLAFVALMGLLLRFIIKSGTACPAAVPPPATAGRPSPPVRPTSITPSPNGAPSTPDRRDGAVPRPPPEPSDVPIASSSASDRARPRSCWPPALAAEDAVPAPVPAPTPAMTDAAPPAPAVTPTPAERLRAARAALPAPTADRGVRLRGRRLARRGAVRHRHATPRSRPARRNSAEVGGHGALRDAGRRRTGSVHDTRAILDRRLRVLSYDRSIRVSGEPAATTRVAFTETGELHVTRTSPEGVERVTTDDGAIDATATFAGLFLLLRETTLLPGAYDLPDVRPRLRGPSRRRASTSAAPASSSSWR